MKKLVIALFLLLSPIAGARAQSTAAAGPLVARILAAEKQAATAAGATLTVEGTPVVTPEAGLDRVALPHMTLAFANGDRLDLGRPAAAMTHNQDSWAIGLIFSHLKFFRADGAAPVIINPGDQDIRLTWQGDDVTAAQIRITGASLSGGETGGLASLVFNYRLAGQRAGTIDANYSGLVLTTPDRAALTVPAHLLLAAHIAPLPPGALAGLLEALLLDSKGDKAAARQAALHVFEQAHSKIAVKTLAFGNTLYDAQGSGAVTMSDTAPNGAVGKATATAKGLGRLAKALNGQPPTAIVAILQLIGRQNADGSRGYDIELAPDGPVLFNGQDIQGLLQGAAALSQFGVKIQ